MAHKVRKQLYIEPDQENRLKQLAKETGLSEAELIRRALEQQVSAGQPGRGDRRLWQDELAYIDRLIAQGPVAGKRTWSRADLYAE